MKILRAIDSLHRGGAETSLVDMVPALSERNVHLSLVTLLADNDALTARIQELEVPVRRLAGYSWPGRFAELRREPRRLRPDVFHISLARPDLVGRTEKRRGAVRASRWEGLGGTLIEAMALELPVVASDIGPVREALGDVGWPLAAVDDEHAVAAGQSFSLAGGQAVAEKVADGRRRFESTFTMTSVADGMVALYSRAIAQARR
jgi:glycosyltransferase involved in cell wall biosynthesis